MNKGDLIGNRYQLDRAIGQGGSGRIWLARDTRLDRGVAIKFLLARDAHHRARYAKRVALEAKIAASIQHPNVVQIFDFGTHEDQTPYIVMEALAGFTLGEAFDEARAFSLDTLIHIMSEVLRGLAAVHDAGIVHRDLKPENIFLVKESRGLAPKLLDFGISRSLEPESRRSAVTTTEGMIIGTPQYMSPEQARGDGTIDKRTDIYSIGTIMFEAFVGLVPFPAKNISELLVAILQREAPALHDLVPQLGQPLCSVVDKALKKDRDQRYAHAAEMRDALLAAAQQIPDSFDRKASLFPPETIRTRVQSKRPKRDDDDDDDDADDQEASLDVLKGPLTAATVNELRGRGRPAAKPQSLEASSLEASLSPASELPHAVAVTPAAEAKPERDQRPARYAATFGAIAALSLGVAVAALIVLRDRSSAPVGTGMIVVQAPAPNDAPASTPTPPPSAAPQQAAPPAEAEPITTEAERSPKAAAADTALGPASKKTSSTRTRAAAPGASTPTDPQLLATGVASAFAKQKNHVIECLNRHPEQVDGSPQLTVRVSLDERGKVTQSELLPESISNQPVGSCVKAAVASMTFPKPDQPMTFRVPLTWRRK